MSTAKHNPHDLSLGTHSAVVSENPETIAQHRESRLRAMLRWVVETIAIARGPLGTFGGF